MSKFNTSTTRPAAFSPVTSEATPTGRTYEGAPGYSLSAKGELFLLAVSNMVGEDTFYEAKNARDERFRHLVHQVAVEDDEWLARFLPWLRTVANMRSAPIVAALEAVKARRDAGLEGLGRQLVNSVLQRADEPGEALAYWTSRYGRAIPKPVKRGVADAVQRLYTERSLAKYDSDARGFRFGDVVDLVHPTPADDKRLWQGDLFAHALDRRHGRDNPIPESLRMLRERAELLALPGGERRAVLATPERLTRAGITWEALAGWLQGPMDAEAWEAIIPSMGYMALLRNLRNFDQAGVSDDVAARVAALLSDPEQVARSRQLPMRFLSAYRAAPSLRWAHPLDKALTASVGNIPALGGRTLILVDTSSSMNAGFSKDGTLMRWDAAALFGIALGHACGHGGQADVVSFSSAQVYYGDTPGAKTRSFPTVKGESLLRSLERWKNDGYFLGGGTDTVGALRKHFAGHDRVVIVTDEQASQSQYGEVGQAVPARVPLYTWNLAGYERGHAPSGSGNRHTFGGLTDQAFRMVPLLEAGASASWPF
ncbi:TROVE domain-containing protein [Microbispora sp. NPDC049125]|uniref:TROVE domain-containing protein n=1 Tax=Microbispora sp. NPDC049125 TaxID=3154929 RepID=UPI003467A243